MCQQISDILCKVKVSAEGRVYKRGLKKWVGRGGGRRDAKRDGFNRTVPTCFTDPLRVCMVSA